jgi:hypothetical protein
MPFPNTALVENVDYDANTAQGYTAICDEAMDLVCVVEYSNE